jgi:hypothetical protein
VISDPNASVLDQDERVVLLGAFLNVDDQRLDIERFRIKHKKRIPVVDRLIERKFMAAEGALYRVTLDGLYALNNDATRAVIQTFNTILPVLASMYEQEGSRKQWTPHEIGEHALRCDGLMVNEHASAVSSGTCFLTFRSAAAGLGRSRPKSRRSRSSRPS